MVCVGVSVIVRVTLLLFNVCVWFVIGCVLLYGADVVCVVLFYVCVRVCASLSVCVSCVMCCVCVCLFNCVFCVKCIV